ncbi:MAG: hypothetical protein WC360_07570 [Opitutales bacterium]|jgi:hypothetical protein
MIQAYIIMGCAGSGRRDIIADLLDSVPAGCLVMLPAGEPAKPVDLRLGDKASILRWEQSGAELRMPAPPPGTDSVVILIDGTADPVEQLEKLVEWFKESKDVELARIITVVNSRLLYDNPHLKLWFDACLYFSDVVLFNKREEVPNKWFSDFQQRFSKLCYPCLFEFVKNGRVRNPVEVLYPEARRMSLAFEFDDGQPLYGSDDLVTGDFDIGDETDLEETDDEDDDGLDDSAASDPYFERDFSGRRKIRLPDIREYLG